MGLFNKKKNMFKNEKEENDSSDILENNKLDDEIVEKQREINIKSESIKQMTSFVKKGAKLQKDIFELNNDGKTYKIAGLTDEEKISLTTLLFSSGETEGLFKICINSSEEKRISFALSSSDTLTSFKSSVFI